jgi:hypothetical protein
MNLHIKTKNVFLLSAREPIGSRDDIWTRADKWYDMKNDMLWYVYYMLQQRELFIVPKCLVFSLELNTYKNVVKEEDIFCFNMQIH